MFHASLKSCACIVVCAYLNLISQNDDVDDDDLPPRQRQNQLSEAYLFIESFESQIFDL